MSTDKTGGPAFPGYDILEDVYLKDHGKTETHRVLSSDGMTLRDYFAAKSLEGLLVAWYQTKDKNVMSDDKMGTFAYWAYGMADAMIVQRDKVI